MKLLLIHRWAGLALAAFLLLAGLTGAVLVWAEELETLINPQLMRVTPPAAGARPLDPLTLRDRVAQRYPHAQILSVPLTPSPGHALVYSLKPRKGEPELANDQVFVDPYTGEILGERKWGDLSQGRRNVVPFIFRLHSSLFMSEAGTLLLGIVALIWTLNCFVGGWLALPPRLGAGFWSRWLRFWKVRWGAGSAAVNYELHRAGGLWLWAIMLVLAWSAVAFNLPRTYRAVMQPVFGMQADHRQQPVLQAPLTEPVIDWHQARDIGRRAIAKAAEDRHFTVLGEDRLIYLPERGIYRYRARSSLDVGEKFGRTEVLLDASTGDVRQLWLPTTGAAGDTIGIWITRLHVAAVGGLPLRLLVFVAGLGMAVLSVTGAMIWWRRRRTRSVRAAGARAGRPNPAPGVAHS
jgi:uncharacterized iron-regulated membrane protein